METIGIEQPCTRVSALGFNLKDLIEDLCGLGFRA